MTDRLRVAVYSTALLLMVGWLLHVGRPIFVPIVVAILFVFVINGLAALSARLPVIGSAVPEAGHRMIAALAVGAALMATVSLVVSVTDGLVGRTAGYQEALLAAIRQGATLLGIEEEPTWQTLTADLMRQIDVAGLARRIAASTLSYMGIVVFILLNTAFLLIEQKTFATKIVSLAQSPAAAQRVASIISDVNRRVGTYLAMKTLMNALIAGATYAILRSFGVEMAIFWAVFVGVVNYVPYFGSAAGVALPVLFALVQIPDKETVLWLFLLLALAQFVVGNLIEPQVMGTSLNLSPWVILISLTVWGSLWGVIGALFSVPITAMIVVICSEFGSTRPVAVLLSRDGRVERR